MKELGKTNTGKVLKKQGSGNTSLVIGTGILRKQVLMTTQERRNKLNETSQVVRSGRKGDRLTTIPVGCTQLPATAPKVASIAGKGKQADKLPPVVPAIPCKLDTTPQNKQGYLPDTLAGTQEVETYWTDNGLIAASFGSDKPIKANYHDRLAYAQNRARAGEVALDKATLPEGPKVLKSNTRPKGYVAAKKQADKVLHGPLTSLDLTTGEVLPPEERQARIAAKRPTEAKQGTLHVDSEVALSRRKASARGVASGTLRELELANDLVTAKEYRETRGGNTDKQGCYICLSFGRECSHIAK